MVVGQTNNQTEVKPSKNTSTMKAKNILMSVLLAMGFIAAKAAGYPPELALVSQPVLVYNYNSITVYYDVQNIGDYTYRGDIYLYLDPDNGYYYGSKYVRVCPGRIKRVSIEIPAYRPNPGRVYTIMPYYEMGNELYSFTTFEYFDPLNFYWNGPRTERWVVINVPPRVRYYTRPGHYRYYYDGFRPPMPPPHMAGHGHGTHTPPPLNPMHHTYGYHSNNGGYPATHNPNNEPPKPNNGNGNGNAPAPTATVRPNNTAGSLSNGNSGNTPPPSNNVGSSSTSRPNSSGTVNNSSSSSRPNSSGSGNVSRPSSNNSNSGTTSGSVSNGSSSNRPNNSGNVSRPNNGNSNNNSGNVSRPSSNTRPSNNTGNSSGSGRVNNSNSNSRPSSGTSSGSSSSGRSGNSSTRDSNSSSNRSGSSSTRGSR